MSRNVTIFLILVAVLSVGYAASTQFGTDTNTVAVNVGDSPVAIHGYDPVAYHTLGEATPGNPEFTASHNDAVFHFASAEHRDLFLADTGKYMPAYGGFCAFGVTQRQKFDIDPKAWEIVDGILYLQLDPGTRSVWLDRLEENIVTADSIWPDIEEVPADQL